MGEGGYLQQMGGIGGDNGVVVVAANVGFP